MDVPAGGLASLDAVQQAAPHAPHHRGAVVERTVADGARGVGPQSRSEWGEREAAVGLLLEHSDAGPRAEEAEHRGRVGLDLLR